MKYQNDELLEMNLQFFAEESESAGENEAEIAEQPQETTETETGAKEEIAEPQVQSKEANAAFASMRREAEAARRQLADIDAMYAKQFGNYKNPETGLPIRSAKDYAEAMAAQQRAEARQQLVQNNIDPALIDNMIQNSPVVRQAQEATQELNNYRAQQQMQRDFDEILKIDSSLSGVEDIYNSESFAPALDYVRTHPGATFADAYKLVNFERLSSSKTEAAKQAVINQVKGQSHLSGSGTLEADDSLEEIPASQLETYKNAFPGRSSKELKALYNKALKAQKG